MWIEDRVISRDTLPLPHSLGHWVAWVVRWIAGDEPGKALLRLQRELAHDPRSMAINHPTGRINATGVLRIELAVVERWLTRINNAVHLQRRNCGGTVVPTGHRSGASVGVALVVGEGSRLACSIGYEREAGSSERDEEEDASEAKTHGSPFSW